MAKVDIIRAWTDEEYRLSLTEAERALVPENPAGGIELEEEEMKSFVGSGRHTVTFPRCCFTF